MLSFLRHFQDPSSTKVFLLYRVSTFLISGAFRLLRNCTSIDPAGGFFYLLSLFREVFFWIVDCRVGEAYLVLFCSFYVSYFFMDFSTDTASFKPRRSYSLENSQKKRCFCFFESFSFPQRN
ncbi:hypothetical protein P167DRAFT_431322 [Morchella conica CCBAS932]|uniref:Uncharacterized protein n=1 Tax=Morchella conica CCBAS932 TaxID=1392247 RepID=A0A3N4L1R6_9PEZI|nr:hypothetical protein P167DRAFT_431322 [Morchella conica CCBAS932]